MITNFIMNRMPGMIFCSMFIVVGIMLLIGTFKKWEWVVNPNEQFWLTYSQSFIKKIAGKKFLLWFTYFLGLLFVYVGIYGIIKNWR